MEMCILFLLAIFVSNNNALISDGPSSPTNSVTLEAYDETVLPKLSACGVVKETPKIYGGVATSLGEMPWIAGLEYKSASTEKEAKVLCMGSLISERYVLTSANCVNSSSDLIPVNVILGDWNRQTERDCVKKECADLVQKIKIHSVIHHENYGRKLGENDIALIRLENDAVYSEFVSPICLPPKNLPFPKEGQYVTVAGWGKTEQARVSDILLKVKLPIASSEECSKKLQREIKDNRFCAGGEQGKDACQGDSGTPAIAVYGDDNNEVRWYQRGIVSSGQGCGIAGYAGIYTKVDKHMDWIIANIKKNNII